MLNIAISSFHVKNNYNVMLFHSVKSISAMKKRIEAQLCMPHVINFSQTYYIRRYYNNMPKINM